MKVVEPLFVGTPPTYLGYWLQLNKSNGSREVRFVSPPVLEVLSRGVATALRVLREEEEDRCGEPMTHFVVNRIVSRRATTEEEGDRCAQPQSPLDRSIELLKHWLTPQQRADFEDFGSFDVIGCDTGKRYRLTIDANFNVHSSTQRLCFVPRRLEPDYVEVPLGDRLLAQKIALETDETAALKLANTTGRAQSFPAAEGQTTSGESASLPMNSDSFLRNIDERFQAEFGVAEAPVGDTPLVRNPAAG